MAMIKFKEAGLKLTPQRLAIFECLEGNRSHPAAEDIYNELKKRFPMISFATVYKTLEVLKSKGYLKEILIDRERKHFDPDTTRHHHLICINCKKIVDIHCDFPVDVPDDQKEAFEIIESQIEFYGICPDCKNERRR